jgi:serine/threonine-protein kinase RsbW
VSTPTQQHAARPPLGTFCVTITLDVPRDARSVALTRHLVRLALYEVGVVPEVVEDIEVALAEACANVLRHSGPGGPYQVSVTIGQAQCELRVVDVGCGFDRSAVDLQRSQRPSLSAERGRGFGLMTSLVDELELDSVPERGTKVRLVKNLVFDPQSPARRPLTPAT